MSFKAWNALKGVVTGKGDSEKDRKTVEEKERKEDNRIRMTAGSTVSPTAYRSGDIPAKDLPAQSWSSCDHASFQLRTGPDYCTNKTKAPSGAPFYEIAGVE
jgi:hypothetical protein